MTRHFCNSRLRIVPAKNSKRCRGGHGSKRKRKKPESQAVGRHALGTTEEYESVSRVEMLVQTRDNEKGIHKSSVDQKGETGKMGKKSRRKNTLQRGKKKKKNIARKPSQSLLMNIGHTSYQHYMQKGRELEGKRKGGGGERDA